MTRAWQDLFTHQTYRDVPVGLANRLDELAAAAAAHPRQAIAAQTAYERLRSQVKELLQAFSYRVAYRRTIDELHAADDGLLPISEDRRRELGDRAATFARLRDFHIATAVEDGASLDDAALAAGVALDEALDVVRQEQQRLDDDT